MNNYDDIEIDFADPEPLFKRCSITECLHKVIVDPDGRLLDVDVVSDHPITGMHLTGMHLDDAQIVTYEVESGEIDEFTVGPGDESLASLRLKEFEMKAYMMEIKAGGCSLDTHPNSSNWVERAGGLPNYMCEVARALHREGRPLKLAIPMGIGIVKDWALGKNNVKADTIARAIKAVAQWEAMKAWARAKTPFGDRISGRK